MNDRFVKAMEYVISAGLAYNQADFAEKIGVGRSVVTGIKNGYKDATPYYMDLVANAFKCLNSSWLSNGSGEMLAGDDDVLTGEGDMLASDQPREYDVETAQKLMEEGVELIPMYSEPFRAGNRGNDVGTEQGYISSYWAIPNLRATEVIQVTGDSMEPTIPRGTPVAVAPVYFRADEPLQLSFGDIFALSTRDPDDPSEYVTTYVKRLYSHDDKEKRLTTWIAHSDNDRYEDFEVPIANIVALWRVLAGVNYYS